MKEKIDKYSINLMWVNSSKDEKSKYVCKGKSREDMDYELNQLKKWCTANPDAEVNFWFDSECTTAEQVENTKKLLAEASDKIQLRDIREIPFVQDNSDMFLESIPVYFRIDFLKLIICLHQLENKGMDSAIFADMSIGDKVEKVLSKQELFTPDTLKNLNKYGMLIGQDTWKPENQFLQTLNTPELIKSLKHAINCCSLLATNALNNAIKNQDSSSLSSLHNAAFTATMVYVYLYQLVLQSKEPVKIRADVVNEGKPNEWVNYDPEKHGPIMFGNFLKSNELGSLYIDKDTGQKTRLDNIVKLPASLNLKAYITEFWGFSEELQGNTLRKDLNPGKPGSGHSWSGPLPLPTQGKEFQCTFWPTHPNEKLNDYKAELDKLIDQLRLKQSELAKKGKNNDEYKKVAENVKMLCDTMDEQMKSFNEPTVKNLENFQKNCMDTIDKVIDDSKDHRGWHKVNSILRAIVGVLAAITAIPALIVEKQSKHGFSQTFFSKPETDTTQMVSEFKKKFKEQSEGIRETMQEESTETKHSM